MNISDFIKPILIGREGVNDSEWLVTTSSVYGSASVARIQCKNKYELTSNNKIIGKIAFNIIFFMKKDGSIEFNKITIGKGRINSQTYHQTIKGELYELFKELRNLK